MHLTFLTAPIFICMMIAWQHVVSFETDRFAEEINRFKNRVPSMMPNKQAVTALYAGIVDNSLNEFVAVAIAKS